MLKKVLIGLGGFLACLVVVLGIWRVADPTISDCTAMLSRGLVPLSDDRQDRFLGKVRSDTGNCRGGERFTELRDTPWVDWSNYWGAGGADQLVNWWTPVTFIGTHLSRDGRGLDGALMDLERQRVELIKYNLFDNYTYETYLEGRDGRDGRILDTWPEMRLSPEHPLFEVVGGTGEQVCTGALIRARTTTGICNDLRNPAMGSTGMQFARNSAFDATFPRLGLDELARNRHGDRIDLLVPDPQVISRLLLARQQSDPGACNAGQGLAGNPLSASCDYKKAPFFNVMAAYWIQFMTHDWFSHLDEGRNAPETMPTGCRTIRENNEVRPLTRKEATEIGCRTGAREEVALVAEAQPAPTFVSDGETYLARAPQTTANTVTAWWDASQIYGYSDVSHARAKRDPDDPAKLLLRPLRAEEGDDQGYLPIFQACEAGATDCTPDPINPKWAGQEATAFPENWSIGLSFLHTLFIREHNSFVDAFRAHAAEPLIAKSDSGLRNPLFPDRVITYAEVSDEDLFQIARLVVAAVIAKIHTIEWTTQLLYDEPLYLGMNSNWSGLFADHPRVEAALHDAIADAKASDDPHLVDEFYSVLSSGAGIVGTGAQKAGYRYDRTEDANNGTNHFGSPFNFTEEFVSVYRLHPLLPDLIELRDDANPDAITAKLPVVSTFRAKATEVMRDIGMDDIALSFGRQRLGMLALQNHPQFLQNLEMPARTKPAERYLDVVALDLIRDRERGIPRFNEFRRQIGLRQLTSFDDFIDKSLLIEGDYTPEEEAARAAALTEQRKLINLMRDIYGTHVCDASKIISTAQVSPDAATLEGEKGTEFPNDCLGHPDGTEVDNIEDLDTIVGYLAETTRPHGFAISETQFQIFIINASRRLFSDRFFTSSYRPEFYSTFGLNWVNNNGPEKVMEPARDNGHRIEMLPMKRVMLRNLPALHGELEHVVNSFDPWARVRGDNYALDWTPRPGAENDVSFQQ
ncbi:peroxidase family protein [Sulfitobacter sp. D35]|uniref:peroxidase family protein n=1 Tax=Sulfitobacter sp. D35 TaxID=3083252 RepID=UPI00296E8AB0|nr:peroxidase family protein [Sulfitobacter sp. D35]MDW4496502.1 peroxidase family protein [Sulfitobacter sp. D35]